MLPLWIILFSSTCRSTSTTLSDKDDQRFIGYHKQATTSIRFSAGEGIEWRTSGSYAGDCKSTGTSCVFATKCADNTLYWDNGSWDECGNGSSCVKFTVLQTSPDGWPSATNFSCMSDCAIDVRVDLDVVNIIINYIIINFNINTKIIIAIDNIGLSEYYTSTTTPTRLGTRYFIWQSQHPPDNRSSRPNGSRVCSDRSGDMARSAYTEVEDGKGAAKTQHSLRSGIQHGYPNAPRA
ncbi:hypothetical protein GQX73_g2786 [Xylaria multiplex]|uniref:Uncharacterized protein n=1 Tax=Xylaria multiplex TaxID=323545 RepID=A0A7C8MUN7_9PEZI|nr:hypothetical protein GQX73_g2786 [Xylaria multiplex]